MVWRMTSERDDVIPKLMQIKCAATPCYGPMTSDHPNQQWHINRQPQTVCLSSTEPTERIAGQAERGLAFLANPNQETGNQNRQEAV
jgi:hypothetical protein